MLTGDARQSRRCQISRVVINDEAFTCREGDNLLLVAREHGSHVWFVCDGRGLCRTCACQVLSGENNLTAPTAVEFGSLTDEQRHNGYRLSCQACISGAGEVRVVSLAEQVRRYAVRIVIPSAGSVREGLSDVFRDVADFALNAATRLPSIAWQIPAKIIEEPPTVSGALRYVADTQRLLWRMLAR